MAARRFSKDDRGATAVEFALLAPVLFLLLLGTLEAAIMGMVAAGLDNALIRTARMIRTGQDDRPVSASAFEDRLCAKLIGDLGDCRRRLEVSVQNYTTFAAASAAVGQAPNGSFSPGKAGDIVVVRATYAWPVVTPSLLLFRKAAGPSQVLLDSRTAFKNEPFE